MKESTCYDVKMEAYYVELWKLEDKFDGIELHHILQRDNEEADSLVRLASSRKPPPFGVFLNVLDAPSVCLEEGKVPALAGATSTSTSATEGAPSPRECVLTVTTHSQCGTEPLADTLPNPPACRVKCKRQELAAPIRADDGLPAEAPEATQGRSPTPQNTRTPLLRA
jgi:hypothetical protein